MILVYIDIETTGLEILANDITVIAVIVEDTSLIHPLEEHIFNICLDRQTGTEEDSKRRVCSLLDTCDRIVAYNGIFFDVPFMAHWAYAQWDPEMVTASTARWSLKTLDFFQVAQGIISARVGMQKMCADNGIQISKSATGKQAVQWAKEQEWEKLESYCMQDVQVLLCLTQFARTRPIQVLGYHRTNTMFNSAGRFQLQPDMTCKVMPQVHAVFTTEDVLEAE